MAALTDDRLIDRKANLARFRATKVAGGVLIFKGALIGRNAAGFAVPAADQIGIRVIGIAAEQVDNRLGVDGAATVKYFTGFTILMRNDTTSPVTQAQVGGVVYAKDDQTVQAASNKGVVAGVLDSLDSDGPHVFVASELSAATEELATAIETVNAAVPLSAFARYSLLSPTGTMAMPLPAGRYLGQPKTIRMIGGASTPIANVTGAFTTDGTATTNAQFNAAGDQLDAVWNGTAWQVLNNASVTLS
jgi:hypothetical protein